MLQYISSAATIVAAAAAVASVVWAVTVWQRQRRHDALQEFRKDLSGFRGALQIFSENNGDLPAIEAGNFASLRILEVSGVETGADLKAYFEACDKTEVFIGALVYGHQESRLFQKKVEAQLSIQRLTGRHNENFPVTNRLLMTISSFLARTSDIKGRARVMSKMIDEKVFPEHLVNNVSDNHKKGMLFSIISDAFTQVGAVGAMQHVKMTDILQELTEIIVSNYLNLSDEQLIEVSGSEKRAFSRLHLDQNDTFTGDIKMLTGSYESMIPSSDWTRLVELRTKLDSVFG